MVLLVPLESGGDIHFILVWVRVSIVEGVVLGLCKCSTKSGGGDGVQQSTYALPLECMLSSSTHAGPGMCIYMYTHTYTESAPK